MIDLISFTDMPCPVYLVKRKFCKSSSINTSSGLRVINADPFVGGRFSALSAFGLVPAALLGIDASVLLDDADVAAQTFAERNSA
jgi:glucose-6-phosphate isomerase